MKYRIDLSDIDMYDMSKCPNRQYQMRSLPPCVVCASRSLFDALTFPYWSESPTYVVQPTHDYWLPWQWRSEQ